MAVREPTMRQQWLGKTLRRLREAAERGTQQEVARALKWSDSKVSRIELARISISEHDLGELLNYYGLADGAERRYIFNLRKRAYGKGTWDASIRGFINSSAADFIAFEQDARDAYSFEPALIPGLLQTHNYASAVSDQYMPELEEKRRQELLNIRRERQEVFDRPTPLVLWSVVSESVFRHCIGSPEVMAEQLEHLLTMSKEYPDVITLRVLPEASQAHASVFGPFVVLSFLSRWEQDIVFLEGLTDSTFIEDEKKVDIYAQLFRRYAMKESLEPEASLRLVKQYLDTYRKV